MILKQQPTDFRVEELSHLSSSRKGRFALYRFEKTGLDHFSAIDRAARLLGVSPRKIQWGGIKDAAASTTQLVTVASGVKKNASDDHVKLTCLGRCNTSAGSSTFDANRFDITVRDLSSDEVDPLVARLHDAVRLGYPNYFDDQRFRHYVTVGQFVGRLLARGNYEQALRLLLTTYHRKEHQSVKAVRRIVDEHWGDWSWCLDELGKSSERSIVTYLADHPDRFDHALELMPGEVLSLHVSAYQSYLFNRVLARVVADEPTVEGAERDEGATGPRVFYRRVSPGAARRLSTTMIDLASPKLDLSRPTGRLYDTLLKEEGLAPADFRLRGLKNTWFGGSPRPAVVAPDNLTTTDPEADELNPGKLKLTTRFELPRGSYATLLFR